VGSSPSTIITRRVDSEEWTVTPPLLALVVLLMKSGQFLFNYCHRCVT
jgi:hypothetical protein